MSRDYLDRFVQIGTSEMYGSVDHAVNEDEPIKPSSRSEEHTRFKCDWSSDVCSSDLCVPRRSLWESNVESATSTARSTSRTSWISFDYLDELRPDVIINYEAQGEGAFSWKHSWRFFETNSMALARLVEELMSRDYLRSGRNGRDSPG